MCARSLQGQGGSDVKAHEIKKSPRDIFSTKTFFTAVCEFWGFGGGGCAEQESDEADNPRHSRQYVANHRHGKGSNSRHESITDNRLYLSSTPPVPYVNFGVLGKDSDSELL